MYELVSNDKQEKYFKEILSKKENKKCADCEANNPNWCAIDLGVFICYNCSGILIT